MPTLTSILPLTLGLSVLGHAALAQAHEVAQHGYILRSSTVSSMNIDSRTARKHGIERSPTRGILNVTVLKRDAQRQHTVPATVSAHVRNLAGMEREISLTATRANGRVSYTGLYDFAPREVLDFTISARPEGSSRRLVLRYRDRMWARQ